MNAYTTLAAAGGMLALSIDRKALADALSAMKASGGAAIIEKRNTIPILGCVLLDATPDKLTLRATDLDVMLSIELPCATDGCGRVAVEFEALHKAVKGAKGESVRLVELVGADAKTAGRAALQHDGGAATLPTRLADDFPIIREPEGLALVAFDAATLKRDLDRAATCISTEETRYYLNGVFFHLTRLAPPDPRTPEHDAAADELAALRDAQHRHERAEKQAAEPIACEEAADTPDDPETVAARLARMDELQAACAEFEAVRCKPDSLCMASTDGHRLARVARPIPADVETLSDSILPIKPVQWIRRVALKGRDGPAYLAFHGARFVFQAGRMRMVGKLVDGTFPDYSRVIPTSGGHKLTFPADALAGAAKLAGDHGSGKTRAMLLSVGEGWATVRATCPDNGTVSGMIEGGTFQPDGEADAFGVGMNAKYLAALMADRKGDTVTLTAQDPDCPILIESEGAPEFTTVLMPMRVDGAIYTPDDMRKANRDALAIFREDVPGKLASIADLETSIAGQLNGNSYLADALATARREAGALVTAAIDLMAARTGMPRHEARQAILRELAAMKGQEDPLVARARAAAANAGRAFPLDEPEPCGPVCPVAIEPVEEPETVAVDTPEPDAPAEPVAQEPEETPETPEEASARIRASQPMFASLQAFKAAAGQGTRWTLENWSPDEGWRGARVRTVATVRARDIGFIGENATLAECQAADVRGFGDRSWIGFPKQPDWSSDPEGLVIYYPACEQTGRGPREVPCMRLRPVPVEEAPQPVETAPVETASDDVAALRALVLDLAAKVEALESAAKPQERVQDVPAPVDAPEAPQSPVRRSQAHERAIRMAWLQRQRVRGLKRDRAHSEAHAAAMVERAIAAEAKVDGLEAANRNLCASIDVANAELAQKSGLVARLTVRVARLTGLLAGRKRQIAALGRDLLIARNRVADIRAAGESVPPLASVPVEPKPVETAKPAPAPAVKARVEAFDDADNYAAAC